MSELVDRRACLESRVKEQEQEHASTTRKTTEQVRSLEEEKQALESQLEALKAASDAATAAREEQWRARCEDLEDRDQQLREQMSEIADRRDCLESRVKEQEQEHASTTRKTTMQVRSLEETKQALESQLETVKAAADSVSAVREEQWRARCEGLEKREQQLQEQMSELVVRRDCLESRVKEQEQALASTTRGTTEQAISLGEEKQVLESQLEAVKAQLWASLQQAEKEKKKLLQDLQECKKALWELECQLKQERALGGGSAAGGLAPGDFLRLMKVFEEENVAVENGRLKKVVLSMEMELEACRRERDRALMALQR